MNPTDQSKALALLYWKLEEARSLIRDIVPLAYSTGLAVEDEELVESLNHATDSIRQHFENFRLQAGRISKEVQ
ncbi:MAG: hypothetical protein AB7U82_27535 [Blastocatellales bacterium]